MYRTILHTCSSNMHLKIKIQVLSKETYTLRKKLKKKEYFTLKISPPA